MNWKIIKSYYSLICPWFRVRKDHVQLPSGFEIDDFYVVESGDWVNIIAITQDNHFIIEEQYRHGIARVCFELPAGAVAEGEDPLDAAQRELLEETGYAGGKWIHFCTSVPNASGMSNFCHTFLARGVQKQAESHLDVSEDIRVHLINREQVEKLLTQGFIIEGVMQAPLWRYLKEVNYDQNSFNK